MRFIPWLAPLAALLLCACESDDRPVAPAAPETPAATATVAATATATATATAAETVAAPEPVGSTPLAPGARGGFLVPKTDNGVLAKGVADRYVALGAPARVRVVSAGGEPREKLVYAAKLGPARPLEMGLAMIMGIKSAQGGIPTTTVPKMVMTLDLDAAEKNDGGEVRVAAKLRGIEVRPAGDDPMQKKIADGMREQFAAAQKLSVAYWMSPSGRVHDVNVSLPGETPGAARQMLEGMNQSFESMVTPLPDEPIGVGAKWQVVSRLASGGADILQFADLALKSRDGTKLEIDVHVTQLAANDQVKPPNMPPGTTATLKSFTSSGQGSTKIVTTDVAPESGKVTLKTAMELAVAKGGVGDSVLVDSTMAVDYARLAK